MARMTNNYVAGTLSEIGRAISPSDLASFNSVADKIRAMPENIKRAYQRNRLGFYGIPNDFAPFIGDIIQGKSVERIVAVFKVYPVDEDSVLGVD